MSNFIPVENRLGIQPISSTNAATPSQYQVGQSQSFGQSTPLGSTIRAYDQTLGEGQFVYLEGVVGTVVGTLVTYNNLAATTTLVPNTASTNDPVAVAMSANVASQYGWYQISGVATILKSAAKINPGSKLAISATAGVVLGGSTAGKNMLNAVSVNAATVASATTTIQAQINQPFMEAVAT
jgi:hypothetical protein